MDGAEVGAGRRAFDNDQVAVLAPTATATLSPSLSWFVLGLICPVLPEPMCLTSSRNARTGASAFFLPVVRRSAATEPAEQGGLNGGKLAARQSRIGAKSPNQRIDFKRK